MRRIAGSGLVMERRFAGEKRGCAKRFFFLAGRVCLLCPGLVAQVHPSYWLQFFMSVLVVFFLGVDLPL